jgi:hypothetical protein
MIILRSAVTAAVLAALLVPATAAAVDEQMETAANATANCQGALPNLEGSIRKRPLAVQNEGTANAFVTCSFSSEYDVDDRRQVSYFGAWMINKSTTPKTVSCTGVAGYDSYDGNVYVSRTITLPANGTTQGEMFFEPVDNGGQGYYPLVSMSCSIPPGVGINDTYVGYVVSDD